MPANNAAVKFLNFLPDTGSVVALRHLYDAISPAMPLDLVSTPVASPIPRAEVLKFNYDEGHAGRFSVPGTGGGSLALDWVLSQPSTASFINNNLAYGSHPPAPPSATAAPAREVAIFCPGMNTTHERKIPGDTGTAQRLEHYCRVLGSVSLAQIHTGTSLDQGDARISLDDAPLIKGLINVIRFFAPDDDDPRLEGDVLVWPSRSIDAVQIALSKIGAVDTPIKKSLRSVLDKTKSDKEFRVALLVYSRASIEIEEALKMHIKEGEEAGEDKNHIEKRLREQVTVVSVGSVTADFPDGPKYIHLAAWNDPLTNSQGVNGKKPGGAGKDAVFLNCHSPYNEESIDNHNFSALTSQFLSVVLATSGATDFADLWEMMNRGKQVIPQNADILTKALIRLTRGDQWLWMPEDSLKDNSLEDALPKEKEAVSLLKESIGDVFVDKLLKTFPLRGRIESVEAY